jgi:flagellar basal body-associated protein FliL
MTNSFAAGSSWIALNWWIVLIACAAGIAAMCRSCLETDEARDQRARRKQKKELRALADKISNYGRNVHQRYPTGDVVVGERDLAEQLRKRTEAVATALNLLLGEQKVQRAPLNGYWKLNV